jgi:hypothetical protein
VNWSDIANLNNEHRNSFLIGLRRFPALFGATNQTLMFQIHGMPRPGYTPLHGLEGYGLPRKWLWPLQQRTKAQPKPPAKLYLSLDTGPKRTLP